MENQNKEAGALQATPKKITLTTFFTANAYSTEGRASRKEFWFAILTGLILNVILVIILGYISKLLFWLTEGQLVALIPAIKFLLGFPLGFFCIIWLIPATVCLCVRRLHDIGIGGFQAFLLFLIAPIVFIACVGFLPVLALYLVISSGVSLGTGTILAGLCGILHLAVFLFLGLYPSQKGTNKYDLGSEADALQATPKKITLTTFFTTEAYSTEGRASRKEFWFAILTGLILNVILVIILGYISKLLFWLTEGQLVALIPAIKFLLGFPLGFFCIIWLIPATVCLCVRRLHDIGIGGFRAFLLFLLAPFVFIACVGFPVLALYLVIISGVSFGTGMIWAGLWGILHLAVFLFLGLYPSQKGANKYDLGSAEEE